MKSILPGLLLLNVAVAAQFPAQKINRVSSIYFGQSQAEVEHLLGKKAVTEESAIDRAGIDYSLEAGDVKIDFDTGKVVGVNFDAGFRFESPVAMFPEEWKNLEPIGAARVRKGMMKSEFLQYLSAWEARAKRSGAKRNDGNELLRPGEYSIRLTQDEFSDMVSIGFGPERSTGKGGGSWGSGCIVMFVTAETAPVFGRKEGTLDSVSLLCDDFNTHARHTN